MMEPLDDKQMALLRYPVGPFKIESDFDDEKRRSLIKDIEETPVNLRAAVQDLNEEQLDTPYRPGGWTVRQVVHHLPDSHLNAYTRIKLALTEENPMIRTYDEASWAELIDARQAPIEISLTLLEALHRRWMVQLGALTQDDFLRKFKHPEWGSFNVDLAISQYAWHGRHHVAHITALRSRMNW